MRIPSSLPLIACLLVLPLGCGDDQGNDNHNDNENQIQGCELSVDDVAEGDPDGHADPLGAAAAGQARAARITDPSWIVQPVDHRQTVRSDDFVLINDRVAVYISSIRLNDGYGPFGGKLLAVEPVGVDGRPLGISRYGETLMGLGAEMIDPHSVTVINDGADGQAAVVRVKGTFAPIPFLRDLVGAALGVDVGMPGYYDYVLEPGSPVLKIRLGVMNTTDRNMDLDRFELYGFFHYSRCQVLTERKGYESPAGAVDWVGFDCGESTFAWRSPNGPLAFAIQQNGLALFVGPGLDVPPCTFVERDHSEVVVGGAQYDGLREVLREVDGEPAWRAVEGSLSTADQVRLGDAYVHVMTEEGAYLSRTRTRSDGTFTIHAPPDEAVMIKPQVRGYPDPTATHVEANADTVSMSFDPVGAIHVLATDASTLQPIPVRIQVVPTAAPPATPEEYGVLDERRGRLHQHYSTTGDATLVVPPGEHRVIVSRGYEYELLDTTVQVSAGTPPVEIVAPLLRSVDTTGYMCADFHVHTRFSADSNDPVHHKLRGQVADGLELPLFSDHEWITTPQPLVVELGLEGLARGVTSLELTTFLWGHFGIVPIEQRPDEVNNGAPWWVDISPADVFATVHALPEEPLIIVNHPRTSQLGGYFNAAGYDRETGEGNELWSEDFDLIEAFNGSSFSSNRDESVADWFSFLERGWDMVVVGSSDNHHLRTGPTGYPRSCLHFGHDDPSMVEPSILRGALLDGDVLISGGLYVNAVGPDGERVGEVITTSDATATVTVTVQAASWIPAETLEVIVNGVTLETRDLGPDVEPGPGQRFVLQVDVPVDATRERNWVIFHARADGDLSPLHPGKSPYGVTNALYLVAE